MQQATPAIQVIQALLVQQVTPAIQVTLVILVIRVIQALLAQQEQPAHKGHKALQEDSFCI